MKKQLLILVIVIMSACRTTTKVKQPEACELYKITYAVHYPTTIDTVSVFSTTADPKVYCSVKGSYNYMIINGHAKITSLVPIQILSVRHIDSSTEHMCIDESHCMCSQVCDCGGSACNYDNFYYLDIDGSTDILGVYLVDNLSGDTIADLSANDEIVNIINKDNQ